MSRATPHELAYAGDRRRWRRRLTLLALVASAIACGIVGRLLYGRLQPVFAARLAQIAVQREIDARPAAGEAYDAHAAAEAPTTSPAKPIDQLAFRLDAIRSGATAPSAGRVIYLGRLRNARGEDRLATVRLNADKIFLGQAADVATLTVQIGRPATLFSNGEAAAISVLRFATYHTLHVDPPTLDADNDRRVLLTGAIDGSPFAHELTIDGREAAQLRDLPTPSTRDVR